MPHDDSTWTTLQAIAGPLIRAKVQRLIGKAGLHGQDRPDLEQELWTKLWPRLPAYDPDKGRPHGFLAIIDRILANQLRERFTAKRDFRRVGSLHQKDWTDEGQAELGQTLSQQEEDARQGRSTRDDAERVDLTHDLEEVLTRLPEDKRQLAEELQQDTLAEIARRRVFGDIAGQFPWGVWEADVPMSLGQFPSLARMIYRGDVKEGDVISVLRVNPADLAEGRFSFSDKVEQQGDVKSFGGSVPPEALAAGRLVVEFTDKSQPSQLPDMERCRHGAVIQSTTKQLAWDTSGKGFFTVNTAGTKAVVGFAEGKQLTLGDVKVRLDCPFASLFITALDRGSDLADGKQALITALARRSNTGFTYFAPDNKVLNNGRSPILLEPVKATVSLAGRPIAAVNILDHDGRRTGRTLPVTEGRFILDGAKDKTIYYEVVFR